MDELLLHISQRLETLQVFIHSTLQNSRTSLQAYSEQINAISLRSRDVFRNCLTQINAAALTSRDTIGVYADSAWSRINPYILDTQERLWLLINWLRDLCNDAWDIIRQQTVAIIETIRIEGALVVTRGEIQIGALGFAMGCATGFLFGLGWQRRPKLPAVCMKAVVISSFSGLDGISLADDIGSPTILQPDEVLIEVVAASIDPTDIAICSGYARKLRTHLGTGGFPLILGRDCSGVVIETGRSVSWLTRGDYVWLSLPPWRSGTMAQLIVARESQVSTKPSTVGFEAASSLPYAALQAWRAAVNQADLGPDTAPGKRILVRDAGSAVGCVLVQLARIWGAQVTAVVAARAKEVARQLGAHDVVVASVDLEMELRTRPRYDIVFNTIGPGLAATCRRVCTPEGVVVCTTPPVLSADSYGFIFSSIHTMWMHTKCLFRGHEVLTKSWGSISQNREILEQIRSLVEQGRLQPVLDRVFTVSDVELAFQHASSTSAVGKTVVHFRSLDQGRCNYGA